MSAFPRVPNFPCTATGEPAGGAGIGSSAETGIDTTAKKKPNMTAAARRLGTVRLVAGMVKRSECGGRLPATIQDQTQPGCHWQFCRGSRSHPVPASADESLHLADGL